MTDLPHVCHAKHCGIVVRPDLFMCLPHWNLVPADLRRLISRHYRNGQENSAEYLEVAEKAQEAVQQREFQACLQTHGSECGCWERPKKLEVAQGNLL